LGGQGSAILSEEFFDGVIQNAQFSFFGDIPDGPAAVDAIVGALVTVLAQGNAQELLVLLDMVGVRWASRAADAAAQFLNRGQVPSFSTGQPIIHLCF